MATMGLATIIALVVLTRKGLFRWQMVDANPKFLAESSIVRPGVLLVCSTIYSSLIFFLCAFLIRLPRHPRARNPALRPLRYGGTTPGIA